MEAILKELVSDLMHHNPSSLYDKYVEIFRPYVDANKVIVPKGQIYYRGRLGAKELSGAIDDFNLQFHYPYYGDDIKNPPAYLAKESRFNRDGYSFLYLSSEIDICFAELRLKVGAICSISEFQTNEDIELLDISKIPALESFMTYPVYDENKYFYRYTQFLAEVISRLEVDGIIYDSIQADGGNCVVGFNPEQFSEVLNSEKMYKASKIHYDYYCFEPEYKKHKDYDRLLKTLNSQEEEKKDRIFEHILKNDKI